MKKLVFVAAFCMTACMMVSFSSCSAKAPQANLKTDVDSLSYAYGVQITEGLDQYLQSRGVEGALKKDFVKGFLQASKIDKKDKKASAYYDGMNIGRQVASDFFANINSSVYGSDSTKTLNKEQFLAGFLSVVENKNLLIKKEEASGFTQTKTEAIQAKINEKLKAENQAFLEDNKTKEGVNPLPSGLQYKVVSEGTGEKPAAPEDTVTVKYKGTTIDGKEFDSNDKAVFPLNRVIPGWTEGMQLMSVGSHYILYVPYDLGYGERGHRPNIEPYATLIFDVELLGVSHAVPAVAPKK